MAQKTLVERHIEDGERLISQFCGTDIEVASGQKPAFWAKESETGHWNFFLITPLVGENGAVRDAYRRIGPYVDEMRRIGSLIDPFDYKVIGPSDPIAKDIQARRGGFFSSEGRFGALDVDEAYIYPSMDELLVRLCGATVSLGYVLYGEPYPTWLRLEKLQMLTARPRAQGELHIALESLGKRLGIRGLGITGILAEKIKSLQFVGGPVWRREAIEKVIQAQELAQNEPTRDSETLKLLVEALCTFRDKLPRNLSLEQFLSKVSPTRPADNPSLDLVVS